MATFDLVDDLLFPPSRYNLLPTVDETFARRVDALPPRAFETHRQGRVHFLNYRADALPGRLVEPVPLTAQTLHGALVTRYEEDNTEREASPHAPKHWSAGIYTSRRELLPEFQAMVERRYNPWDYTRCVTPARVEQSRCAAAKPLPGRFVYLGTLRTHFGHFLLESLARAWAVLDLDPTVKLLFHPSRPEPYAVPGFAVEALAALGVEPERIVVAHEDLIPETLVVPTAQFAMGATGSPGMCLAFDRMRDRLSDRRPAGRDRPSRVYLTRRLMDEPLQRRADFYAGNRTRRDFIAAKTLANEDEIEALFAARGFEIIAPETRSLAEQVDVVAHASHVAGVTGSALHLALFGNDPKSRLIALDPRWEINQFIIEQIRNIEAFHINCAESTDADGARQFDCGLVWQALKQIA
ncbi:MAG: glycosyltransferase family 61 protein [Reyranellaceae bacterium]